MTVLILASRSPRRARLLEQMGLVFDVVAPEVDESRAPDEPAAEYVVRLARAKAEAGAEASATVGAASGPRTASPPVGAASGPRTPEAIVIGADTIVVLDGRILGKPADEHEAVEMLLALAGRTHSVMTGVAVLGPGGTRSVCVITEVRFRAIERPEAVAYVRTGEGADKAGAYGIQGIGGIFAASVRGSYSAVVGLPLAETEQLLRESGLDTWHERTHG